MHPLHDKRLDQDPSDAQHEHKSVGMANHADHTLFLLSVRPMFFSVLLAGLTVVFLAGWHCAARHADHQRRLLRDVSTNLRPSTAPVVHAVI